LAFAAAGLSFCFPMLFKLHSLYTYTKDAHFTRIEINRGMTIAPYSITYKANVTVFKKLLKI